MKKSPSLAKAENLLSRIGDSDVVWDAWEFGGRVATSFGAFTRRAVRALHGPEIAAAETAIAPERESDEASAWAVKGRLLYLSGRWSEARAALEAALRLQPGSARAAAWLGLLWAERDHGRAALLFEGAAEREETWAWPRLWLAAVRDQSPGSRLRELELFHASHEPNAFSRFLLCRALLRLGRVPLAEREARRWIAAEPGNPGGHLMLCRAALAAGDWPTALREHGLARDRNPDISFPGSVEFGLDQQDLARSKSSGMDVELEQLDRVLARHPGAAVFHVERAEILRDPWFGRFEDAFNAYREAEKLEPRRAWVQAYMARAEGQAAGLPKSLERLERAHALCPEAGWILAWRGEVKRRMGNDKAGLADFDAALKLSPWYGYAHAWRGAALARAQRWAQALRALDAALEMEVTYPTSALALATRSLAKRRLGDGLGAVEDATRAFLLDQKYEWGGKDAQEREGLERAAAELDEVLRAAPGHAWALAWRGYTRFRLRGFKGALEDLTAALERDAGLAWAFVWRALVRRESQDSAGVVSDLRAALALKPGLSLAVSLLADESARQGDHRSALELLDAGERAGSVSAAFFLQRADVKLRLGDAQAAASDARRALSLDRGYADAHALLGRVLLEAGDSRAALDQAEEALRLKPDLTVAYLTRGMARGALGDLAGRITDFKTAYRAAPELFAGTPAELLAVLRDE